MGEGGGGEKGEEGLGGGGEEEKEVGGGKEWEKMRGKKRMVLNSYWTKCLRAFSFSKCKIFSLRIISSLHVKLLLQKHHLYRATFLEFMLLSSICQKTKLSSCWGNFHITIRCLYSVVDC